MITVRPQAHFDDLYTAVYCLIDDAKSHHDVIKLYKGSHASPDPHPVVLDYGMFFAAHRRGVLGYACHIANPRTDRYRVYDLDEFDRRATPRVSTRRAFTLLARTGQRPEETLDAYLSYVATRHHRLGARHRDFPDIALDNNPAERALRTPVLGRKNYYGSHATWAADLAARVWTITATAERNHREPLAYLIEYLQACATAAGQAPKSQALQRFLPWPPNPDDTPASHNDDPPKTNQPDTGAPSGSSP